MRIYLPATLDELGTSPDPAGGTTFAARRAHAVTDALRAALPDEDDEGLEYAAQLAAADDALLRIAAHPGVPELRLVLSADVPDAAVTLATGEDDAPSAVDVTVDVLLRDVACGHVDEPEAAADVRAALTGDASAVERLSERDLLWYDASELGAIPR
ncbi:DUF6912 family protein [Cellulomonas cellasea]|uniref:Uncharacterized protein n=1 Tax=Cellulomonas cellasea TaxID=43670 RepID=A0A7W4YBE0_9CELL|nr:hypothetical protein [Cellulomonas cellasea]MBB2922944.1 hypothetical protein [Cellulomonas cellasea]